MPIKKIFIAGHKGMVGSAILRRLKQQTNNQIVCISRSQLDLTDQNRVNKFFFKHQFDEVYIAAARVGGIYANNKFPAEFIYHNLQIQNNLINAAYTSNIKKLLFLGSSCIYPKHSLQPIREEYLLTGELENTNEAYAIAKISGLKMIEFYNKQYKVDFRALMPTNLYGPNDNYHPLNSHVIPGLIRKFHEAKIANKKIVKVWGSGMPKREFLYVDDLANACTYIMDLSKKKFKDIAGPSSFLNVGSMQEFTIKKISSMIANTVGFKGKIEFDNAFPDGTPRKLLDSKKIHTLGWSPKHDIVFGLNLAYKDFLKRNI